MEVKVIDQIAPIPTVELWRRRMVRWRKMYPDPSRIRGKYEPAQIRATPLKCAKCGGDGNVTRHHKGHEYFFACIMEEWYAARYIRFLKEDVVPLCHDKCHIKIHTIYQPIIEEARAYIRACIERVEYDADGISIFRWKHKPDFRVLESFRKRLISKCNSWLARKRKRRKRF